MSQHGCVVWGGRRDNLPEVLMLIMGLLAAGVLPGTVELPSILLEIRALALTQRAPKYIPGKGKGSTQAVTLGTWEDKWPRPFLFWWVTWTFF